MDDSVTPKILLPPDVRRAQQQGPFADFLNPARHAPSDLTPPGPPRKRDGQHSAFPQNRRVLSLRGRRFTVKPGAAIA
jgi:hypothetical protein